MIELKNKVDIQKKINTLYAPNHCYNLDTLEGNNTNSKKRIEFILPYIKKIVKDKTVLDIGTNKGLFTILSVLSGAKKVIAQDIDNIFVELTRDVIEYKSLKDKSLKDNIEVTREPIGTLFHEGDVALILGVSHYLTYDYGLDWIYRLYIMGYDLLIEFPFWNEDRIVQVHKRQAKERKIREENLKLLNKESFLEKTKGLYKVEELGRFPGLRRRLFYCQKIPVPAKNIKDIDMSNYKIIYNSRMMKVYRQGDTVLKISSKYDTYPHIWHRHYADRWVRTHIILKKEFPKMIPQIYSLVKDDIGNTKGMIQSYCPPSNIKYENLFKIQTFLLSINMIMADIHPNHINGNYVIDLEFIENLNDITDRYIRNRILNVTWKQNNFRDKNLNMETLQKFLNDVRNNKNLKDVFKKAESYNWKR